VAERIDAKDAVRIAIDAMRELYPEEQIPGLALEEVEQAEDGATWNVTLGYSRGEHRTAIEAMTGEAGARTYKVLRIDAATGTVRSMKNRVM
jgi:hypothetical protein